jgi:hypothetical protein
MTLLSSIAAAISLWLLGYLLVNLFGMVVANRLYVGVLAFVVGALYLAVMGSLFVIAGVALTPLIVYVPLAVLLVLVLGRKRSSRMAPGGPAVPDPVARVFLVFTGVVLAAILALGSRGQLWWDGWAIWAFKARVLIADATLPNSFLDPSGSYVFTHLDYPLLVPLVDWWFAWHGDGSVAVPATLAGALWFALIPLTAWSALAGRVEARLAAATALALALFWPVAHYAVGGTADVVIAIALLGAALELQRALGENDHRSWWRFGLFLALGAVSKNEGLALAVIGTGVGAAALWRSGSHPLSRYLPLLLPFAALGPWFAFTRIQGIGPDNLDAGVTLDIVIGRIPVLLAGFVSLAGSPLWLFACIVAVAGVAAALQRWSAADVTPWTLIGLYFLTACAVYLQAPQDIVWLISTSLDRVAGAIVPAIVALSVLTVFSIETSAHQPPAARLSPQAAEPTRRQVEPEVEAYV